MANFLITTPNSLTQGTDSNDLLVLSTALGTTVYGNGGADQISASGPVNGVNAILNGGAGNDSIYLTAGAPILTVAKVLGGAGNDLIVMSGATVNNSTIHGGGGADTIVLLSGSTFSASTINGMGGADLITASDLTFANSLLALGGGNDTLNLVSANIGTGVTIAAGGGSDLISANVTTYLGPIRIEGDTIGDSEFFGNDTIRIGGDLLVSSLIQGGGGADVISASAALGNANTVNGNAGADIIAIDVISGSANFVGGGAGADSISLAGIRTANAVSVYGGGGVDLITVSGSVAGAGLIVGGEGSDTINVRGITGGFTLGYASFSESNIANTDFISAAVTGNAYTISQSVVSASTGASLANSQFTTNSGGVVTFTAGFASNLTTRLESLDRNLTQGQTVAFSDGNGNSYIFIQGGGANSGLEGDFLAQTNVTGAGFVIAGGTGISVNF